MALWIKRRASAAPEVKRLLNMTATMIGNLATKLFRQFENALAESLDIPGKRPW
jgi:hypothetical protein